MARAYKLVALDMDGTLLNDAHVVSNVNRQMLLGLHARYVSRAVQTDKNYQCTPLSLRVLSALATTIIRHWIHEFSLV